jgi:hypothetical protein
MFMLYARLDKLLSCLGCMLFAGYTSFCIVNTEESLLEFLQCCLLFRLPVNARTNNMRERDMVAIF